MATCEKSVIFDLDGTLWDTCDTCAIAWNHVLETNGIAFRQVTAADVRGVTGLPHGDCIRTVFSGLPDHHIEVLIRETETADNEMIAERGGNLYPGVIAGLKQLASRMPLFIVSNCQAGYIETFLEKYQLTSFFQDIECWGNTGQSKSENLRSVIDRNQLIRPVFVGDTEGDRKAAMDCNVPFWFVSYGFGQCATYDRTFHDFPELVRYVDSTS